MKYLACDEVGWRAKIAELLLADVETCGKERARQMKPKKIIPRGSPSKAQTQTTSAPTACSFGWLGRNTAGLVFVGLGPTMVTTDNCKVILQPVFELPAMCSAFDEVSPFEKTFTYDAGRPLQPPQKVNDPQLGEHHIYSVSFTPTLPPSSVV